MANKILKKDWATFTQGDFTVENNVWNKGDLANGRDYTQTISYNPKDLNHELTFAWNWPSTDHILAFPEIEAGYKPWSGSGSDALTSQISKIAALDVTFDYDLAGSTSLYNVGFDMWLTKQPNADSSSITAEVSVWTHAGNIDPDGKKMGVYKDGSFRADIYVDKDYSHPGANQSWEYITLVARKDMTSGTLDMEHLLDKLTDMHLVKSGDYFNGYEFGAQLLGGKGSLTIHDIEHEFSASSNHGQADMHHAASAADAFWF
jgi:uncharacterized protein YndB with AHSA1/START domain